MATVRTGKPITKPGSNKSISGIVEFFTPYSQTKYSQVFEIIQTPLLITAYSLQSGETITVNSIYGPVEALKEEPFSLDGSGIVLTPSAPSALINVSGRYRLEFDGELGIDMYCVGVAQPRLRTTIPQPSGAQANLPNLFFDGVKPTNESPIIEVIDRQWVFNAYGLQNTDVITVYIVNGSGPSYREIPFVLEGQTVQLSTVSNSVVLKRSGRYRFKINNSPIGKILVGNPTVPLTTEETGGGTGGVTSVSAVGEDGITVVGSPITSAGVLVIGLDDETTQAIEKAKTASIVSGYPNGEAFTLVRGTPVSVVGGQLRRSTSIMPFDKCIGLVYDETIAPNAVGNVQIEDKMVLTIPEWETVTGMVGGLAAGQNYFPNAVGKMTPYPTNVSGEIVQTIGFATSNTEFIIDIGPRIGI